MKVAIRIVWIATFAAFAAQIAVARDVAFRPAVDGLTSGSVHPAAAEASLGTPRGTQAGCGDGVTDAGEECDDGNIVDGDGCDAACRIECSVDTREWNQIAKLAASDAATANAYGQSVSVSGDTAVVGVVRSRAAYVFGRNVGGADAWGQVAKLTVSDAATYGQFGWSVAISGDTVVVGDLRDDGAVPVSGSAFVFDRNAGGTDAWGRVAKLTASDGGDYASFGWSVAIQGDTVVVGARDDTYPQPCHPWQTCSGAGSAYVFERNRGGADAWGQVAKLIASDPGARDYFGTSVSVSGDTVVVSSPHRLNDGGYRRPAVYVFQRSNSGGTDTWHQTARLVALDGGLGEAVSISGDTIAVGNGAGPGTVYVFERNIGGADAWGESARLTASDALLGDEFGASVSVRGDTMVVGARFGDDAAVSDSGAVYVFERNVRGAHAWEQVAKLTASDAALDGLFGYFLSMSGNTVVAAVYDDAGVSSGAAYILRLKCGLCGDGDREAPEECDEGTDNSDLMPDACRTDCTLPGCGDAVTDSGEACDDGTSNSDTAPDACRTDCVLPACGDGVTDTEEVCDDGNTEDGDLCSATCQAGCGDGILQAHEQCDDGIANSDTVPDACRTDCGLPSCGDETIDSGEGCDDGASNSDTALDACRADCALAACGDGVTDSGEECDDGNSDNGDGCDATCQNECAGDAREWNQIVKLTSAAAESDNFGGSVAVSGDTLVVGAAGDDEGGRGSGAAYVFVRDESGAGAWVPVAKLTAPDAARDDYFGSSVSVSGNTVVVGAYADDDAGSRSGSAYVFERNAGGADAWAQVAKLTAFDASATDDFGRSVSVSGDTIVVGAGGNDDAGSNSGSAYVFERDVWGVGAWGQVAKLTAPDAAPGDSFGFSVAVSGGTVVVGAYRDDDVGSAYVFERNAGWGQIVAKLTASDAAASDAFGVSVSVSGDWVVVGSTSGDGPGSAYVFGRDVGGADAWSQSAVLTASDAAVGDLFGGRVSVSGDRIVVGATGNGDAGNDSGSAYVFELDAGGTDAWGQVVKRTASDARASDRFGASVAVSGDTAVVGAYRGGTPANVSGSAYILSRGCATCGNAIEEAPEECDDGTANSDAIPDACRTDCALPHCGDGVADSGEACDGGPSNSDTDPDACRTDCRFPACGDGVTDSGEGCDDGNTDDGDGCNAICQNESCGDGSINNSACVSNRLARLTASDAYPFDEFGWSVSVSGDTVVVGADADDDAGYNSGSAYVFGRNVGGPDAWGQIAKLTASDAASRDYFGFSVSVSGDTVVVGAYRDEDTGSGSSSGSAYVFGRHVGGADAWGQVAKLTPSDGGHGDYFGWAVSVSGNTVVVGAPRRFASGRGSAYVFGRDPGGDGAWGQVAKLTVSDGPDYKPFGISVSISGGTVVVGDTAPDGGPGSAYVFERDAGGTDAWGQTAKLTESQANAREPLGNEEGEILDDPRQSPTGEIAVIGPRWPDERWSPLGVSQGSGGAGISVSVSDDTIVMGASADAYVFERDAGGSDAWGQVARLIRTDGGHGGSLFRSVAVSGDLVLAGSYSSSLVHVFVRDLGGADAWGHLADLTGSYPDPDDDFGGSVAVSGGTLVVGAGFGNPDSAAGSAYILTHGCEECDDGTANSDLDPDACRTDCTLPSCGDNVIDHGEACDDGAGNSDTTPGACGTDCTFSTLLACGDGITDPGEECDDGNTADGDGCSSTCHTEMSPNLIASGGFERSVPWRFFTNGMGMFRVVGEEAVVTIGNSGSNTQLFQRFGGLVAGTYQLDFDVKSSVVTRAKTILVNETDLSWIAQAGFRARSAWSHVTSTLVVPADVPPGMTTARLSFYMPGVPNGTTLHFDNVVLKRVGPN